MRPHLVKTVKRTQTRIWNVRRGSGSVSTTSVVQIYN